MKQKHDYVLPYLFSKARLIMNSLFTRIFESLTLLPLGKNWSFDWTKLFSVIYQTNVTAAKAKLCDCSYLLQHQLEVKFSRLNNFEAWRFLWIGKYVLFHEWWLGNILHSSLKLSMFHRLSTRVQSLYWILETWCLTGSNILFKWKNSIQTEQCEYL